MAGAVAGPSLPKAAGDSSFHPTPRYAMHNSRSRQAFTLLELLVVIGIVAVLLGLLSAAVMKARAASLRMECANHLRQLALGLHQFHGTQQTFPPGVSYQQGTDPYPFMSWQTRILPYIEQDALWKQAERAFQQDRQFLHVPPHDASRTVVPMFTCPADARTLRPGPFAAFTAYLGVAGLDLYSEDGMLFLDSRVRFADVTDGTSYTLLLGERPPSADGVCGWWYAGEGQLMTGSLDSVLGVSEMNVDVYGPGCPRGPFEFGPGRPSDQCAAFHFWSLHSGGAHFLFVDGAVRFLAYPARTVLPALATRDGGEIIDPVW